MRSIVLGIALVSLCVGGCEGGSSGGGGSGGGGSGGGDADAAGADAGDFDANASDADSAPDAMVDGGQQPDCGDGELGAGESCDDGNASAGDGCTASCGVETGFACSGEPSTCSSLCGDGVVASDEHCDDANTRDADGCSDACFVETGWSCNAASPSDCMTGCGDGVVAGTEECDDDGNVGGDGCSAACDVEIGYDCKGIRSMCSTTCGDSITAGAEACDDGSILNADGCSGTCSIESGFTCAGSPSVCNAICGDAIAAGAEACDDGGTQAADGCSGACSIESGFACAGSPSICNAICGDSIVAGAETCDDGGSANSDGCSSTCLREDGYTCAGSPSVCETSCGDGVVAGDEECDDQGVPGPGGCSNTCSVETGYDCTGAPSVCSPVCGDGLIVGGEACDDGNTLSGDCCSSTCTHEASAGALTCETEPNNIPTQANGPISSGGGLAASISPTGDVDLFAITLLATSDLRIETFDGISNTTCTGINTLLHFYNSTANELVSDDDDGIDGCSLLNPTLDTAMRRVVAGTYYIGVEELNNAGGVARYNARVSVLSTCGDGVISSTEECDDDGTADADGCSAHCVVEPSHRCSGVPSTCIEIEQACSDGIDNNANGLTDNADPDCVLAAYFPGCGTLETLKYYDASSLPAAIPDSNATGVSRSITCTASGTIARAALLLSINHSYDADLDVTLVSPSGASFNVTSDNGGTSDNYLSTVFDSTCATSVTAGAAPFSGCYRPEVAFDSLVGSSAAGAWTVQVADDGGGDTGTLTSAWLVLCVAP